MFLHVLHGQSFQRKASCGPIAGQQSHKPARACPCANTSSRASRKARRPRSARPTAIRRAIPSRTGTARRSRRRRGWGSRSRTPAGQDHQRRNPLHTNLLPILIDSGICSAVTKTFAPLLQAICNPLTFASRAQRAQRAILV